MKYITIINGQPFEIDIDKDGNLRLNGELRHVDFRPLGPSLYSVIMDDQSFQVVIDKERDNYAILMRGRLYEGQVMDERSMLMSQRRGSIGTSSGELQAPMPGLIVSIEVEPGQTVQKGETCVILESMKMQNELKVPVDGVVQTVDVEAGQIVDKGAVLVTIVAPDNSE